ncbi:MAG: DUF4397 domain-containing protein [Gemmatimonadetes bacterium]|nr:DUF4397 domain-containing protein [Gemmatimonadota bacterium]
MKLSRLAFLVAGAAVAAGCDVNAGGTPTVNPPAAYVRYVNAVSDLNAIDIRFVDVVEGSPNFTNIQFRQYTPYQAATAGTRALRAFVNPTPYAAVATPTRQQLIAQTVLDDQSFTLTAGTYYTIYLVGQSGLAFSNPDVATGGTGNVPNGTPTPGGVKMYLVADAFPTITNPPAATVYVRSVNLGQAAPATSALGTQDIYVSRETDALLTSVASPNGTLWAAVPPHPAAGSVTPYVALAPRPTAAAASAPAAQPSTYRWSTQATAAPGVVVAQLQSYVIGLAGNTTSNGTGGAQVAGSIMTALVYPRSVAGSAAPQSAASGPVPAFTAPSVFVIVDRNPPRTAP